MRFGDFTPNEIQRLHHAMMEAVWVRELDDIVRVELLEELRAVMIKQWGNKK
jgi:hypothetical protein